LHFVWNKKSPIQKSKRKRQNAQFLVVYINGIFVVSVCYNKGVGYLVTFVFGWAFGDAFVSMNSDEILTPSLYVNFK
jgi:hypothetical protein